MAKSLLAEAFEQLDLIDSGEFDFSKKGAEELAKFKEDDAFEDFETVIDPNAKTEEELQDSYIGMVILGCDVCNSMIYKAPEDVVIDEESQMANIGECCPYCYETDGFKVIGRVAPFEDVSVEVTDKEESEEEKPEPTVKVNGKDVPVDEAPEKEEEAIEASQKYPVQSPISESVEEDKPLSNKEKLQKAFPQLFDDEENEDGEKIEEDLSNIEKLMRAYPELELDKPAVKESVATSDIMSTEEFLDWHDNKVNPREDMGKLTQIYHIFELNGCSEDDDVDYCYDQCDDKQKREIMDIILTESFKKSIKEGMEDISITTDDQVIKVKATPRADKETIEPITPVELEKAQEEAAPVDATAEESAEEVTDDGLIDLEEIDSESFDELGESYLKKVYDNVNSFKTVNGEIAGNNLILEGLIEFTSGKKAKTKFIFEGKEVTKKGKIKFVGLNENLSKNKRAFTLTGTVSNKNLICEQFNYNYLARDEKGAKRLYGTIKK